MASASRDTQAAEAVEFAFVVPVLLALVFGLLEGMWLIITWGTLSYAVQHAARVASLPSTTDPSVVSADVANQASILGLALTTVTVTPTGSWWANKNPGDAITVTAQCSCALLAGTLFHVPSITLSSQAHTQAE